MTDQSRRQEAIVGIRRKLARAQQQLDLIEDQTDAYWRRQPIASVSQFNADFTHYATHLRIVEPPPVEWGVIFGEAVHNMRSALDHCIYQLTIHHHGTELAMTGFPIYLDPLIFEGREPGDKRSGRYQIRGLLPEAQTRIEALQPYHDPHPKDTVLWSLHEAWNQDKHRVISLMTALTTLTSYTLDPVVPATVTIIDGLKEDGTKIADVYFNQPSPHVKVNFKLDIQIVDQLAGQPDVSATVTYKQLLDGVALIVNELCLMMI